MEMHDSTLAPAIGRVVYKYELELETIEPTRVRVGPNSKLLHVASQPSGLAVWIEQETATEEKGHWLSDRYWDFLVVGTGKQFPLEMWEYAGTAHAVTLAQDKETGLPYPKALCWHIYSREVPQEEV